MPRQEQTRNLLEQEPGRENRHARAASIPRLTGDHRETAETYAGELFRLGRYRVAVCRDGIQWLFQRQRPTKSAGGAVWDTLGYCVTRKGLMRLHRAHVGPDALEIEASPSTS